MGDDNINSINKIIENLFYIHPLFTKGLTRSLRTKTNLNPGSLYILGILSRHDMLSMSEIGCKLSMPKPHVTAQIDKLIAENIVERLDDPNDRRIINIKLTEKGKEDFTTFKKVIGEEMQLRIQRLDQERIKTMLDSSQQLRDILSEIMRDSPQDATACSNH
jgi:DNA-binding MarR family transcriptional regulator